MSDIIASAEITVTDVKDGVGIEGVITRFLATHLDKGVTTSTGDWSIDPPLMDVVNKYLWSYETITYTDGHKQDGKPAIIGVYGEDGVGIENIFEYYLVSDKSTGVLSTDSRFKSTIPTMDETDRYLWKYEEILYTNNERNSTSPVVVGVYGDKGTSIKNIKNYYLATSASSGITRDTDGFKETMQPLSLTNKYLWNYETIEYENPTSFQSTNPVIIGVHGEDGKDGVDAKLLYLSSTLETMSFDANGDASPTSQTATIEAKLQNTSGSISFVAKAYNGTSALSNSIALGGTGNSRTLSVSSFPSNATHVSITATLGSLTDTISIFKLRHGKEGVDGAPGQNAIVGYLTNESITLGANSSGRVGDFTPATGTFRMFDGTTEVTKDITFDLVEEIGLAATIHSSTGVYKITAMSSDTATAEFKATYKGVSIFKTVTLSKSIAGEKGDPGSDAPTISLSGDSQMIKQDISGNVTPSKSFNITGVAVNTTITRWLFSVNGGEFKTELTKGVTRSGNIVTVDPETVTFNTLSIRVEDGTVTDTFTIGRAVDGDKGDKGDKGDEGLDGIDAITVVLTNESHTFAGDTTSAIPGSVSTEFLAFKGANRASVKIGDIAEMPDGMNSNIDINNSQNAKVTFNVTTDMKSRSGIVTIPLTVDGKTINKTFSYSLSLKGDKGDRGEKGATGDKGPIGPTGTGISDVVEWYLATDQSSDIASPTPENPGNWTTEIQTMTATNKYLWNYEEIKFSDGTSQPTIPVIIGVYGDTGGTGATGRSITAIQEYYMATSASKDVTRPNRDGTNGWTTTMQLTTPTDKYLWNYEKITWSSGTTTTYVEPIIIGVHGEKGDKGDIGADAKLLYLSASAEAITFNSDNTPNPATQTITFTANMQNTTGTATFTAIPYNGATAMAAITLGGTGNTRTLTQNQFPAAATRIQIKAVLGSLNDTVSVVKLKNGATGGKGDKGDTGAEGKNAIVGYLTNENITFPANSSGVVTSENLAMANGVFKVFDGLTEKTGPSITYRVVTQTGATGAITTAGAYSVSKISADNASITFRATYSDVTIDKVLTLSKSKEGVKGDKGDNAPLVKLSGTTQIITQSNTGARTPSASFTVVGTSVNTTISAWSYSVNGGTFGTGLPKGITRSGNTVTVAPGSITFNTLSIKATGGGVSDTFTIARIVDGDKGAKGDTGSTGGTGAAGKDGADAYTVLLSNESHTFQAGTTNAIAGSTTTDIHAYKGTNKIAVTIDSITEMPKGMDTTIDKDNARVTFRVNTDMKSPSGTVVINLIVDGKPMVKEFSYALTFKGATGERGPQGPQGATGLRGPIGNTGTSVESITEYYLATSASKDVTTGTDGWKTDMQPMTPTNKYLWNYEKINFSDNTSQPTIPVIIGVYGDKGQTGGTGATGRSIVSITEHYLVTSANSGVTRSTSGWDTKMKPTTETERYLWNYETVKWSSGTTPTYVEPIIIGVHGAKGATGATGSTGPKGATGPQGISPIVGFLTNESITLPASSAGAVSSFTGATGTFEVYDGTTRKTGSGIAYSVSGTPSGITVSINATTGVYKVSAMTTGTSVLSGTATLRAVYGGVTVDKILTVTKALAGTQGVTGATGATGGTGATGPAGQNATSYWLTSSSDTVIMKYDGDYDPKTITFYGHSKTGTNNTTAYAGYFIIQTSTDGTSYKQAYRSSSNQSSYAFKIPSNVSFIKAKFYQAGGTTYLLDEQTVPVLRSAENLEIGGRNLLRDSQKIRLSPNNTGLGTATLMTDEYSPYYRVVGNTNISMYGPDGSATSTVFTEPMIDGNTYTVSVDVRVPKAGIVSSFTWNKSFTVSKTNEWVRISYTYTYIGTSFRAMGITFDSNTLDYRNWKIEKGNKATDWTEAPEDAELRSNKKTYNPVRYIRDWLNGSTANTGNHWGEIQAIQYLTGENIAKGKPVTSNGTLSNPTRATDGAISTTYANASAGYLYAQVDLGQIYYDIESVLVSHYYVDGRKYNQTKTEVSTDGVNWVPIFDSLIEGEYAETSAGRTSPNTQTKSESLIASQEVVNRLGDSTSNTTINGRNITTGRVQSKNSLSWLDLDTGHFNFGNGGLVYSGGTLALKGTLSVSNLTGTIPKDKLDETLQSEVTAGANANTVVNASKSTWDSTSSTVSSNSSVWGRASNINSNGTISSTKLDGKLADSQITSAGTWNAKETTEGAKAKADAAAKAAEESAKKYVDDNTGNLVNNPAATGNHTGWSGSGLSSLNQTFEGVSTRVLQTATSGNVQYYSSYFKVDPSKAYEVSAWFKKSIANSSGYYLGLNGINSSGATVPFVQTNQAGGTVNSNNTNFYFDNGTAPTDWVKVVGYIMPAGTKASDLKGVGTKDNAIMKADVDRIRVRFLNWNNSGTTRNLWVANPKVVEVDPNAVIYAAKAQDVASAAKTTADGAVTTANSASSTANSASSTASQADAAAKRAESTAGQANTTASSANTTANSANTKAGEAVTTANSASSTAGTAKKTADSTKKTVDDNKSKWDDVVNKQKADSRLDNMVSEHNMPYTKDIIVYGDSNKYYPVYVRGGNQDLFRTIKIWRRYGERGPNDWHTGSNSTTHKGSLMLTWKGNFGGWGGAQYREFIEENTSAYSILLADCFRSVHSMAYTFMLKGGGSGGAIYHMASDQNLNQVEIYYNGSSDIVYPSDNANQRVTAANPVTSVNSKRLEELKLAKSKEVIEADNKATDAKTKTDKWTHPGTTLIGGDFIETGTMTANRIKARTITADRIATGALTANEIASNAITAVKIASNSITADKIVMGTGTPASGNLASGRTFSGSYSGTVPGNGNNTIGSTFASFGSGGSNNNREENAYIHVDLGGTYQIAESRIFWYAQDLRRYYYKVKYSTNGSTWFYAVGNSANNGWTVSKHPSSGSTGSYEPTIDRFAIPITARYLRIYGNGNTSNTSNHIYEWELYSKVQTTISGSEIVTGTLSAGKITTGTMHGDRITANTLSADRITGRIPGGKITLDGDVTVNGTFKVSNDNINSGIQANKITTGTMHGNRITAGTLSADRINANTLSAITANLGTVNAGSLNGKNLTMDLTTGDLKVMGQMTHTTGATEDAVISMKDGAVTSEGVGFLKNKAILSAGNLFLTDSNGIYFQTELSVSGLTVGGQSGEITTYKARGISLKSRAESGHLYDADVNLTVSRNGVSGLTLKGRTVRIALDGERANIRVNNAHVVDSGSNTNGNWVKFYDGTQICWHRWTSSNTSSHSDGNGMWRSGHINKTHAQAFTSTPSVSWSALGDWRTWIGPDVVSTTSCNGVIWRAGGAIAASQTLDYIAIGRWK